LKMTYNHVVATSKVTCACCAGLSSTSTATDAGSIGSREASQAKSEDKSESTLDLHTEWCVDVGFGFCLLINRKLPDEVLQRSNLSVKDKKLCGQKGKISRRRWREYL
jgi:hypothetical protein